jgi:hypothetical protein
MLDHLHHLGDHVTRALDAHDVAVPEVLAPELLAVVQRRARHGHAADDHRPQEGEGGEDPGAPHRDVDLVDACDLLARRELEGERSPGMVRRHAHARARRQIVDLDDDAVDLVVEVVALGHERVMVLEDLLERRHGANPGGDLEAPLLQRLDPLRVGGDRRAVRHDDVVGEQVQVAAGRHGRVQLADRPGRRVARRGVGLLSALHEPSVEALEIRDVHHDLAAQREQRGRRPYVGTQAERHGLDGPHVLRHALADEPVSTRDGPREHSVLVDELDGGAIELRLDDVGRLDPLTERLAHPLVEPPNVRLALCGIEREHRRDVLDGLELLLRLDPHPLGGRVRGEQPGVTLLQLGEARPEPVELGVGDRRPRLHVVEVRVPVDLLPEPRGLAGDARGHVASFAAGGRVGRGQGRGSEERLGIGKSIGDRSGTGNMEEIRAGGRWVCRPRATPPRLSTRRRTATVKVSRPGCVPVSKSVR